MKYNNIYAVFMMVLFSACFGGEQKSYDKEIVGKQNASIQKADIEKKALEENSNVSSNFNEKDIKLIRLSHHVNTSSNEYFPCYDPKNNQLFFTGMDRTGFFDHKIDFTKTRSFGGEDIFVTKMKNGLFEDATPVLNVNTNAHESVNQVLNDGSLILSGNYDENLGPGNDENGSATEDLFQAIKTSSGYRLYHFEEPVNSIYTDLDGCMSEQKDFILFASDRPKGVGAYHKKGWMWNATYWGNTDIYVAFSENGNWTNVVNLGNKVNTPNAERTPFLSSDGLRLYISSNGHKKDASDMDIYFFKRKDKNNWNDWDGPYNCSSLNSTEDDWGYKEYEAFRFFSRSEKLKFEPTSKSRNGTGFVFENNYRAGYDVNGAQSGSFNAKEQTDIYMVQKSDKPSFTLPDALFDVDQSEIRKTEIASFTEKILDLIKMNAPLKITIEGHTDNSGTNDYNLKLSLRRAETVKRIIVASGYPEKNIIINGLGSSRPIGSNDTPEGRQRNRRVEVYF